MDKKEKVLKSISKQNQSQIITCGAQDDKKKFRDLNIL